jgi:D-3-phosphoglycerate dehydrogenase / 2-oxoglutarate reductase
MTKAAETSRTILFTGNVLPEIYKSKLENLGYRVVIDRPDLSESELITALSGVDAYIIGGSEIATRKVIESADKLKIVCFFGVGYESYIDVQAATEKGIAVTNTPGANAQSVAEVTVALMLDTVKRTTFLIETTKQGQWRERKSWNLEGKTLGIIGFGAIGKRVAKIAHHGFGMRILYHSRERKLQDEAAVAAEFVDLETLLKESDVVSLHASSNPQTIGLLGLKELALMKRSAVLVNCSRAELVDPSALCQSLITRQIACAAFDGYYTEPMSGTASDKHGLFVLGNDLFLVSPHTAYFTEDATEQMAKINTESIVDLFEGRPVCNLVNPDYCK